MLKESFADPPVNQERWLVSYADLLTLLMAFFVVMYSIARLTEEEYTTLTTQLSATFKNGAAAHESKSATVIDLGGAAGETSAAILDSAEETESAQKKLGDTIQQRFEGDDNLRVRGNEEWLEIELDSNLLFGSGGARLKSAAKVPLARVARELANSDFPLRIEGFTDNVPIRGKNYASNWALSFARASAVLRFLASEGVSAPRMAAVGYGEFRPLADNSTPEGRAENRRVVIKMAKHVAKSDLAGLPARQPGQPVKPTSAAAQAGVRTIKLEGGGLLFTNSAGGADSSGEQGAGSK